MIPYLCCTICTHSHSRPHTPTCDAISDACYILSFAIIMLNTSLHNPNVKHKVREREKEKERERRKRKREIGREGERERERGGESPYTKWNYGTWLFFLSANGGAVYIDESWYQWWKGPPSGHAQSECFVSVCLVWPVQLFWSNPLLTLNVVLISCTYRSLISWDTVTINKPGHISNENWSHCLCECVVSVGELLYVCMFVCRPPCRCTIVCRCSVQLNNTHSSRKTTRCMYCMTPPTRHVHLTCFPPLACLPHSSPLSACHPCA